MSLERSSLSKNPGVLWRIGLLFLAFALLASAGATAAPTGPDGQPSGGSTSQAVAPESSSSTAPYLVRLGESNLMLAADPSEGDLDARAWQVRHDEVAAALEQLAANGLAGAYTYEETAHAFRADLTEAAADSVAANPHVASVEPWSEEAVVQPSAESASIRLDWSTDRATIQATGSGVSSAVFIQVHSPFVWGRVNIGGLAVRLLLRDASGTVIAGASQLKETGTAAGQRCSELVVPDTNGIKVDPNQLYFETVFKACDSDLDLMIRPGYKVQVITMGDDPGTPAVDEPENKQITVKAIEAWTSYENNTVTGYVRDEGSLTTTVNEVIVTFSNSSLSTGGGYTDPSTYTVLAPDAAGNFTASIFRTLTDPNHKVIDMVQGSRGFVRAKLPTGDEVYTVHGQNLLVLENSPIVHGYAYRLPSAPSGLIFTNPPIAVTTRPAPKVEVTVTGVGGPNTVVTSPDFNGWYTTTLPANIAGGDTVVVTINGGPENQTVTKPITAAVDVPNNEVVGTTEPNTALVIGVGRINGFVAKNSTYTYVKHRVTADSGGDYRTGPIKCGSSNYLRLAPGSFGYAGYEDARGNFVYTSYAAPANYVMIDYPLVEGWVANGLVRPTISVEDSDGSPKHESVAEPMAIYLLNEKIFVNVYYAQFTTAYTEAGDTVTVTTGGMHVEIPVPSKGITPYLNDERNVVSGLGPPGATLTVIPASDRYSRKEVVVEADGRFAAQNPYTSVSVSTCAESTKTQDFAQGDYGRVYLRYPDGNEVFAFYGRAMSALQNENRLELWLFPYRGINWTVPPNPSRSATVKLTRNGNVLANTLVAANNLTGEHSHGTALIKNDQGTDVLIRAGDRLDVTFTEGPDVLGAPQRAVTLTFNPLALLTATPDLESSTIAGVGPVVDWQNGRGWSGGGWQGRALLTSRTDEKEPVILARNVTAYGPIRFETKSSINPQPIAFGPATAGQVSFSNDFGQRVWIAWAVTTKPVKITGRLHRGATVVCGTIPADQTERTVIIYDVITHPETGITELREIGTGTAGIDGVFCVTVDPALILGHVIMAWWSGSFSQPVVVTVPVFLPMVRN